MIDDDFLNVYVFMYMFALFYLIPIILFYHFIQFIIA